jgi:hypothetical protein
MGLKSLIFRDTFEIKADYGKLATYFKTKLDDKYFKGYIDRDETQLFFYSGAFKRPLSARLPIVQLNIDNKVDNEGKIKIRFKIVDFALILFGLANGSIIFFSIVNVNPGPNSIPPEIPPIMFIFSYSFLLFMYMIERSGFKKEIEQLELRQ